MNDVIKEIAKQCGALFVESSTDYFGERHPAGILTDRVDLEKFAQSIVLECIQNIRDNMEVVKVDTLGDKDLYLETLRTSGHFYITELEQHFGVEE